MGMFALLVAAGVLALMIGLEALGFLWPGADGLSRGERRVLSAYFTTLTRGVPWAERIPPDELLRDTSEAMRGIPSLARLGLRLAVWGLERLPALVRCSHRSLSRLGVAERRAVLDRAAEHRSDLVHAILESVQVVMLLVLASRPEVLRACGVDRPSHVAACRAARERALAACVRGDPP